MTAISLVETATSDDLLDWSVWQAVGSNGELASPNKAYIKYRITLSTLNPMATPKLLDITLHDIHQTLHTEVQGGKLYRGGIGAEYGDIQSAGRGHYDEPGDQGH